MQFYKQGQSEGAIFKNRRKERDSQPDMNGRIMICPEDLKAMVEQAEKEGGALVHISGWYKQGKEGTFLSISPRAATRARDDQPSGGGGQPKQENDFFAPAPKPEPKHQDLDDEIPF